MATALKKTKIERDRFTEDGVRLFNPSLPHGVVYSDGFVEVKFIQLYEGREMHYKGDGAPVGYQKGVPMPPSPDELLEENSALHMRIRDLEESQRRTNELLERLSAQLAVKAETPTPPPPDPAPAEVYGAPKASTEAPARGAAKPK